MAIALRRALLAKSNRSVGDTTQIETDWGHFGGPFSVVVGAQKNGGLLEAPVPVSTTKQELLDDAGFLDVVEFFKLRAQVGIAFGHDLTLVGPRA